MPSTIFTRISHSTIFNRTRRWLLWGAVLLACPAIALAQHHGGGASLGGGGGLTRPDGVDEKDTLQDFHRAMEVQATSLQATEFQAVVKNTEAAKEKLQEFQQRKNEKTAAERGDTAFDQALENARSGSKKFVEGFSDAQKSGLRETIKRLDKADSDVEQEVKRLDQVAGGAEVNVRAESMEKALADFSNQQLALGRQMGIILANGQDLTFNLPPVKSVVRIGNRGVGVAASGELSQVSTANDRRTFALELVADLSDLQRNIEDLLRAQLDRSDRCGEQVAIRQAMFTPSTPTSVVFMRLHFERWICTRLSSQVVPRELGEGDGGVEVKLTAAVEKSGEIKLSSEFGHIDGNAMVVDSLRSGNLGDDMRDGVTKLVLSAIQAGTDLKSILPPAVQGNVSMERARFQNNGSGDLSLLLEGQAEISNAQANELATQLNKTLSAQDTTPH